MPWQPAVEQAWRRLHAHLRTGEPFVELVGPGADAARLRDRLARALRPVSAALVVLDGAAPPEADRQHPADVWWVVWAPALDDAVQRLITHQIGPDAPARGLVVVAYPDAEDGFDADPLDAPALLATDRAGIADDAPTTITGTDGAAADLAVSSSAPVRPPAGALDAEALRETMLFAYSMARLGETETALKRALVAADVAFSWADGPLADESRAAALATLARVESLAGDHAAAIDHTTTLVRLPGAARHIDRGIVATMVDLAGRVHDPRSLLELADELEPFLTLACGVLEDQRGHGGTVELRGALALLYERTAEACETLGELERAEGLRRRCLQLREQELGRNPGSLPALLDTARAGNALGRLLLSLGRDEAKTLFERALDLRRRQVELDDASIGARRDLAGSYVFLGDALARDDDALAAAFYAEAVALERALVHEAGPDPELLDALSTGLGRLARERRRRGDLREAQALAEEVLEVRRAAVSLSDGPELLRNLKVALGEMAAIERDLGHLERSQALRAEALAVARRLLVVSPEWALAVDDLAVALAMVATDREHGGDLEGALTLLGEAAELCDRYVAATGRTARALDLLASNAGDRARVLRDLGRYGDEEELADAAIVHRREALDAVGATPDRRQALARALNAAGTSRRRRHGAAAAEPLFTEAARIFRELLDTTDRTPGRYADLANCLINLGNTHLDRHDVAAAERAYREALILHREAAARFEPTPSARRSLTLAASNVALARARLGAIDEAIDLMAESLAERQALLRDGLTTPRAHAVIVAAVNLAALDARAGRLGDAAVAIEAGRTTLAAVAGDGPDRPGLLEVGRGLAWAEGLVALEGGEPERAEPALARAVALARRHVEVVTGGHGARRGLAGALVHWARAVLDATAPAVPGTGSGSSFAERRDALASALDEATALTEAVTGDATGAAAAPLAECLGLAARVALADGRTAEAAALANRAVALTAPTAGEPPEIDRWRTMLEARAIALRVAANPGAAGLVPEAGTLADALPSLADRGRVELGQSVAIHRAAITADLTVAMWAATRGDRAREDAARRRAAHALVQAEARFATPVAWARLRAALDRS